MGNGMHSSILLYTQEVTASSPVSPIRNLISDKVLFFTWQIKKGKTFWLESCIISVSMSCFSSTTKNRACGFVRRCPACDKNLVTKGSYCTECGSNYTQAEPREQECNPFYTEHYFFNALRQSGQNSSPESILTNCSSGESFLPQPSQLPLFPETARISV